MAAEGKTLANKNGNIPSSSSKKQMIKYRSIKTEVFLLIGKKYFLH